LGFINYGLPFVLNFFGFGFLGIIPRSIAAWIQSLYGASSIFSLFQSTGARGGIKNPLMSSIASGSVFNSLFNWRTSRDRVAECLNYYDTWSFYLTMFNLLFIVVYYLFRHRL
jgi:hypothetical protein